jgi:hypothetical protein
MKRIIFIFCLFFIIKIISAQDKNMAYSKRIDNFRENLIKGALLPDSSFKIVAGEIDEIDFNRDGLIDNVFEWRKKNRKDGDTTFVSIYVQRSDSTFQIKKTFTNLYPMFFNSYDPHVKTGDKRLDSLKSKYAGVYPLLNLKIKDDLILIEYGAGAGEKDSEYYIYNDSIKNWFLEKHTFTLDYGSAQEFKEYKVEKNTIPIDSFTYFKW